MDITVSSLIILMALFHAYAFILEVFLWQTAWAFKAFGTTKETAGASQALATNQGVYNLFIAAGLVVSLLVDEPVAFAFKVFFLTCIVIAALTAGLTVSKRIMIFQGTPALVALTIVILTGNKL